MPPLQILTVDATYRNVTVYSRNHTKHEYPLWVKIQFFDVKTGGSGYTHFALNEVPAALNVHLMKT
jgi:hypothetical protein